MSAGSNAVRPSDAGIYRGLTVVELCEDTAGEQLGQLLAMFGADVIKVEPPGGAPSRRIGPFAGDVPHPDRSLHFWFYNRGKRSVVLDVAEPAGREALAGMLESADVAIVSAGPARLAELGVEPVALSRAHPRLVAVAVTPFGLHGPWADHAASDLVSLAAGGPLISCGYDDHTIPPVRPGGNQAAHTAAAFGHIALLLALLERRRTGRGQVVDVSIHESLAVSIELANPYWFYQQLLVHRQTCRHALPNPTPPMHFLCADGRHVHFNLLLAEVKPWHALVGWLAEHGMADDLAEERYCDPAVRQQHFAHVQDLVERFFRSVDADAAYHGGQARGLPIGILNAPEDLLGDEHLAARGFFRPVDTGEPDIGTVSFPGAPFRFSSTSASDRARAPRLGEQGDPRRRR